MIPKDEMHKCGMGEGDRSAMAAVCRRLGHRADRRTRGSSEGKGKKSALEHGKTALNERTYFISTLKYSGRIRVI